MPSTYHINPRFRAYGKARIDVTRRAKNEEEWQQLWREPANSFPFEFQNEWKFSVEYRVDDFAAEVGFFIDILGFRVMAFSPSYAQFTNPDGDFCIGVSSLRENETSTPPDALRLQLRVEDLLETVEMLSKRGIVFEQKPVPVQEGSNQAVGYFRTPHGVCVDLWGEIERKPDIHDLMEGDVDEAESDRIIEKLLNLPDRESEEDDEADFEDEDLDEDDDEPTDKVDAEDKPESKRPPDSKDPDNYPTIANKPAGKPSIYPIAMGGGTSKSGRNASPEKSASSSRGNGELTYSGIEDDFDDMEEGDL